MGNLWNQSGRQPIFLRRHSPRGPLPHHLLLFSLLTLLPACLVSSCDGRPDVIVDVTDDGPAARDSSAFTILLRTNDNSADTVRTVRRLDVFIYEADGLRELLGSRSYSYPSDSLRIYGPGKERIVVAIANSPREFNIQALGRHDSIELLSYAFDEDDPDSPLMSGQANVGADGTAILTLTPLMSRVKLGEIANTMKGYIRLEDPSIHLENMNASGEIMRSWGFHPSEMLENPPVVQLPYDIGIFPQAPGSELFCYPNDSQEGDIGTALTVLVLECGIDGQQCRFEIALGAIKRNTTTFVDISVAGPDDFESKLY